MDLQLFHSYPLVACALFFLLLSIWSTQSDSTPHYWACRGLAVRLGCRGVSRNERPDGGRKAGDMCGS